MIKSFIRSLYFSLRRGLLSLASVEKKPALPLTKNESILFFRLDRIGDLTLSTPIFRAARTAYPDARISVLVRANTGDIVAHNPHIDEVIVYRGFWRAVRTLRGRFTIVVDLQMDYYLLPALLARLLKPRVSIGYELEGRGNLFTTPVMPSPDRKHFVEHLFDLAAVLGIEYPGMEAARTEIFIDTTTATAAEHWKEKHGIPAAGRCVALHPGGFYPTQRWAQQYFSELVSRLSSNHPDLYFFLIGSSTEQSLLNTIFSRISPAGQKHTAVVCGEQLLLSVALIRGSALFIGNNSGLLHTAVAVGTPTVSTMGPTIPWLWSPWGAPSANRLLRNDIGCNPCSNGWCAAHTCLTSITVEEIQQNAEELLATEH